MSIDSLSRTIKYKPIVLIVLDGWGISPSWGGNAISMNNPPTMNSLWREYPHLVLQAFRPIAGPSGKVGNSEIGHASIGTGRMIKQDLTEITNSINDGSFYKNQTLINSCKNAKNNNSTLHFIGLLSDGAIHSHIDHLFGLLELAKRQEVKKVAIHVICDGRDTEETSALEFVDRLERKISEIGVGKIVSIIGRHYAMDRGNNIDRTSLAYELQVKGIGNIVKSAKDALRLSYKKNLTDEYIPPFVVKDPSKKAVVINDGDSVVFYNFRADRARQLTRFYTDKNYLKRGIFFRRYKLPNIGFTTLTSYHLKNLPINVAFSTSQIKTSLAHILSDHSLKQLHVAESEKYAHVTYFFNGGVEEPFLLEDREIIPSLKVKSYKDAPEMSAHKITKSIINAIKSNKYDFIVVNYANVDMVGHTGDMEAASKAISHVDKELALVKQAVLASNGILMVTADHGNAEQMSHLANSDTETMHTLNPVPFILVTPFNKKNLVASALTPTKGILEEIIKSEYTLADVAPTILELLDIAKPTEMTGKSLLRFLK